MSESPKSPAPTGKDTPDATTPAKRASIGQQVRTMGWNFWICNLIEAFERLSFFGVSSVRSLYIKLALRLSDSARGGILGTWALIQCLVPMVSGGYTDAYGFRLSMMVAFVINIIGYSLMANANGFGTMMTAACLVGLGTAIFKPPVQGSVAKALTEENSGLGFGIFYWIVNIGGLLAPMAAAALRGNEAHPTWNYVFYGAAIATAFNFLPAIFLFREPALDPKAREKKPWQVFAETITVLVKDRGMLVFLMIISGFWFMFMQLWDLLPVFIAEWVDTRDVGQFLMSLGLPNSWLDAAGGAKPEILINIDSFTIILFVLPLSWLFSRFSMMTALLLGMAIGTVGFVGTGISMSGAFVSLMIFVFAIGEIICSPKFTEYIGMTAPPDKKALYMGYSNIPFAIGWAGGNFLSGSLYQGMSDRTTFARRYLLEELKVPAATVDALKLTKGKGKGKADVNAMLKLIAEKKGIAGADSPDLKVAGAARWDATRILWAQYRPWIIWIVLGAIGLASLVGMWLFYLSSRKKRGDSSGETEAAS